MYPAGMCMRVQCVFGSSQLGVAHRLMYTHFIYVALGIWPSGLLVIY